MLKLLDKLWYEKEDNDISPGKTSLKRYKLFVVIMTSFLAVTKLLPILGVKLANIELIIPSLVVVGALSLHVGKSEAWSRFSQGFGIFTLLPIILLDLLFWGIQAIYLFTWSGFLFCWVLATRFDLSMFDKTTTLVGKASLIAVLSILFFDVYTAFGFWWIFYPHTRMTLVLTYMAQIPFTLYHLLSALFVPPMIVLGQRMTRVKVPVAQQTSR